MIYLKKKKKILHKFIPCSWLASLYCCFPSELLRNLHISFESLRKCKIFESQIGANICFERNSVHLSLSLSKFISELLRNLEIAVESLLKCSIFKINGAQICLEINSISLRLCLYKYISELLRNLDIPFESLRECKIFKSQLCCQYMF